MRNQERRFYIDEEHRRHRKRASRIAKAHPELTGLQWEELISKFPSHPSFFMMNELFTILNKEKQEEPTRM